MSPELTEILHKYCPSCRVRKPLGNCPLCSHFKGALSEAKREGYLVAVKLIEKNPLSAGAILKSLANAVPPEATEVP